MANIDELLKQYREQTKLTQEAVAEIIGVSAKTISNWETGRTMPDIRNLLSLARLYHLPLNTIFREGSDVVKDIETKEALARLKKPIAALMIGEFVLLAVMIAIGNNVNELWLLVGVLAAMLLIALAANIMWTKINALNMEKSTAKIYTRQQIKRGVFVFVLGLVAFLAMYYLAYSGII